MRTILITVALTTSLAGCTSKGLYAWGGYDENLYLAYKDPTQAAALRQKLEAHVQATEKAGQKVAPGLYAEIGTLYLQGGQRPQAIAWYQREQKAWPESRTLMAALIQNLERLESAGAPARPVTGQEAPQ